MKILQVEMKENGAFLYLAVRKITSGERVLTTKGPQIHGYLDLTQ